jgi:hypothetical protein
MLKDTKTAVKGFTLYVVGEGIEKKATTSPPKSPRRWRRPRRSSRHAARQPPRRTLNHAPNGRTAMPAYKRILLKLSGEALMGDDAYGINRATIVRMVREVQEVTRWAARWRWSSAAATSSAAWPAVLGRHGPRHRRLHGHAGHGDELAGAGRHHAPRGHDRARDVGHRHRAGGRALRAAQGAAVPGRRQDRRLRRRHRQPVLHHRHRRGAARRRDRRAGGAQGDQGRRRVQRRPEQGPASATRYATISFDEVIARTCR